MYPLRMIIVAKKFEPELRAAARAVAGTVASMAAHDAYELIKSHLRRNHIPHEDRHMEPRHLPAGCAYHTGH